MVKTDERMIEAVARAAEREYPDDKDFHQDIRRLIGFEIHPDVASSFLRHLQALALENGLVDDDDRYPWDDGYSK